MKTDNVVKGVIGFMLVAASVSAAFKTSQTATLKTEIIGAVTDSLAHDSVTNKVFIETGLTLDPHKSDSAKVKYLNEIGYFDTLRLSECTIVLVPKSINKLVSDRLNSKADSLLSAQVLEKLTP